MAREHGVFLCFRGEDTREGFTGHLFQGLTGAGIDAFMDDQLPEGRRLPEILDRIEDSRISVVIFSENFASSEWCLDELVKILECERRMGQEVLPVFYKVDPAELRGRSRGKTAEYLASHAEMYGDDSEKIMRWRLAINYLANGKGWHFKRGVESKLVSEIVEKVRTRVGGPAENPGAAVGRGRFDIGGTIIRVGAVALVGAIVIQGVIVPVVGMAMVGPMVAQMTRMAAGFPF